MIAAYCRQIGKGRQQCPGETGEDRSGKQEDDEEGSKPGEPIERLVFGTAHRFTAPMSGSKSCLIAFFLIV